MHADAQHLQQWWQMGYGGEMEYLIRYGDKRWNIQALVPGSQRVVSLLFPAWPDQADSAATLANPDCAYIARYALGRDYHKIIRKKLALLCSWLYQQIPHSFQRGFVDSAPVFEKSLARQSKLGWIGKNTLLLNQHGGSAFFISEIYTSISLPADESTVTDHCGSCTACLSVCPTKALVAPRQLDARLCISYWTIESKQSIPESLRPAFGNRVFGCDDCQLVCPWNRYAQIAQDTDLKIRHRLHQRSLAELALIDEAQYLQITEGSALRRTGYAGFLRNIAVGLGNARNSAPNAQAIHHLLHSEHDLVKEHALWAAQRHQGLTGITPTFGFT